MTVRLARAELGFGSQERAPYAINPGHSRGRLKPEPDSPTRTPYQRDRDRIIHSTAFRRLKHKTQVFVYHEGDHFRTRLTHSIEVSQIARSIARALRLDEDLAEALALAHDLGHTPFGHEGEDVLDACMADFGGFDHNSQSLRIVTKLERRYAEFDGLNLAWETLEGLVKHNGPLTDRAGNGIGKYAEHGLPQVILDYPAHDGLMLWSWPSAEAQAAAIADDIAYDSHDLDDGLRAGLFRLEHLKDVPLWDEILAEVDNRYPGLETPRRIHELVRRAITRMVEDVIGEAQARIQELRLLSAEDIRAAKGAVIGFSPAMAAAEVGIKTFLFEHMYRHEDVLAVRKLVAKVVRDLYDGFLTYPHEMPDEWADDLDDATSTTVHRRVCDYIAGMTDRYAIDEHSRLFDDTPELR
ncbi:deoxyguanosinetriphosphate triphosphohydrolase [Breoghania sp.]|uniref:deoxyguanosinetriphosphate triphosphohydrolase n=1 Tax=Breoghania sp. TaxID=2065378 RepID=UPI00262E1897|nr:deoxyguanosinetriphosphate triphosphohydrolase [Breoghania sp.]MDJ0929632.1 deoxyguanosinetriphosphate triphosphohydrolase [Breoghania sp.]